MLSNFQRSYFTNECSDCEDGNFTNVLSRRTHIGLGLGTTGLRYVLNYWTLAPILWFQRKGLCAIFSVNVKSLPSHTRSKGWRWSPFC